MFERNQKPGHLQSGHLNNSQMAEVLTADLAGEVSPVATAHLAACSHCRAEVDALAATLGDYRAAVIPFAEAASRHAADRRTSFSSHATDRAARSPRVLGWALTSAAALALLGGSVGITSAGFHKHPVNAPVAAGASSANTVRASSQADDERLLSEINQDLATALPPSLAPLSATAAAPTSSR